MDAIEKRILLVHGALKSDKLLVLKLDKLNLSRVSSVFRTIYFYSV